MIEKPTPYNTINISQEKTKDENSNKEINYNNNTNYNNNEVSKLKI